ncbi:MAG: hypothetical protein JXR64_02845 [Spirochaetales bacterium]|nr:hypothetical protein [Spirochaetales bacterium]
MKKIKILKGDGFDLEIKEMNGYDVELKSKWNCNYPAVAYKNENGLWYCIHEYSGLAFNGIGQKTKNKAIEEATLKVNNFKSKEYVDRVIYSQVSVNDKLKKHEQNKTKFKSDLKKLHDIEKEIGIKLPICGLSAYLGKLSIDVVKLDSRLRVPQNESLSNYIIKKYGGKINDRIKELI